ncbi:MAG: response regulator [Proteobacteria bacterium]|nr:response regulator [Pseudomonadota bacterium]
MVEDEPTIALGLRLLLNDWGYGVTGVAARGEDALIMAAITPPDLVLMDVRLDGGMDGIETAAALRQSHAMPIVFLTAQSDPTTAARLAASQAGGVLLKPVEPERLRGTIAGLLPLRLAVAPRASA